MSHERLRVLFVCGRGRWRSPTAAKIFERDPALECRARGVSLKSDRTLSRGDVDWADLIFVMERSHKARVISNYRDLLVGKKLEVLDIPDEYQFMDPELIELLESRVGWHLKSR